jgi:hypothetical protein
MNIDALLRLPTFRADTGVRWAGTGACPYNGNQNNNAVDFPEEALPVLRADSNEIGPGLRVVVAF